MRAAARLRAWLRTLFRRSRLESDMDAELHLIHCAAKSPHLAGQKLLRESAGVKAANCGPTH